MLLPLWQRILIQFPRKFGPSIKYGLIKINLTGSSDREQDNSVLGSSMISTASIKNIIEKLKMQHHRESTKAQYYTVWKVFNKFLVRLDIKPTTWEERLNLFVGYLIENNKQSATVKSYISAIKSTLIENDIELNEDRFLLNSLVRACQLQNDCVCHRLPIKKDLVKVMLTKISQAYHNQPYLEILYTSMISTAYFRMFRIGEITKSACC